MTDTYVIVAFKDTKLRPILCVRRKTTKAIGLCAQGALEGGSDYISIRRIRNE